MRRNKREVTSRVVIPGLQRVYGLLSNWVMDCTIIAQELQMV